MNPAKNSRWVVHVLLPLLVLTAFCLLPSGARSQGSVRIPIVTTVPATCSVSGTNSPVMVWKRSGANPGLYLCISGLFQYQTNTFGSGLTAKTMIYANATPAIVSTTAPTDGQLLIGDTSDVPALGTLTNTANETLITNGAHSITIGLAATLNHKVGSSFNFQDPTDATKQFQFVASGISTGTTRSITVPDSNTTLPIASQVLTFAGPTAARTITFPDAAITVARTDAANTFTGNQTFTNAIIGGVQALSGAGAINVTNLSTAFTSTAGAQALTLADGANGQIKTIAHVADGGSGVLTPTTKSGYSTITFTNVGDAVTLQFFTTAGWIIIGQNGVTVAP